MSTDTITHEQTVEAVIDTEKCSKGRELGSNSITLSGVGEISIGVSSARRLQTASVFFWSLYFVVVFDILCIYLTISFCMVPITLPFMVAYLVWMNYIDDSPITGSRKPLFKNMGLFWRSWCDYFPITLIKTAELDPETKYVFGYHPHGVISVGALGGIAGSGARTLDLSKEGNVAGTKAADAFSLASSSERGWEALFPGIERRLVTLPVNFGMPFLRELNLYLGLVNSDKRTFGNLLKKGKSLVVVVGGAREAGMVKEGEMTLVLEGRKGFVREAILGGASLVPIVSFGENDLFHMISSSGWIKRCQDMMFKATGVAFPLFRGRSIFFKDYGLMPNRKAINVVVGAPIHPPRLSAQAVGNFHPTFDRETGKALNEDAKVVEEMHRRYVKALDDLYQKHKEAAWNKPGLSRKGSLKIT